MFALYPNGAAPNGFSLSTAAGPITPPPPVIVPPSPSAPRGPAINEATIMRFTTINVSAVLGPAAINLTANLP